MAFTVLFIVRIVLLGLWVGAMAGFAFLFAPAAFAHIGPTSAFAATIAASVRALGAAGFLLGGVAALATLVLRESLARRLSILACVVIAFVFNVIETHAIVPKMETTPLLSPAYESLHRTSSGVYSVVLLSALLALVLSSRSAYR